MTKMTASGVSTTKAPGQEQFETFTRKSKKYVSYDYRAGDGTLFSCVAPTLEEARRRRDQWLEAREA